MDPVTVKDNVNATAAPGTEVLKTPHAGCEGLPAHPNAVAADHVQVHAQPPVPTPQTDGLEILGNTDTVAVAQHMVENLSSPPGAEAFCALFLKHAFHFGLSVLQPSTCHSQARRRSPSAHQGGIPDLC